MKRHRMLYTIRGKTKHDQEYEYVVEAVNKAQALKECAKAMMKQFHLYFEDDVFFYGYKFITYKQYKFQGKTHENIPYEIVVTSASEDEAIDDAITEIKLKYNLHHAHETGVEEAKTTVSSLS